MNAAAHVSNALDAAAAALTVTHSDAQCVSVTVMVLVSSASGPRVSGCIRAPRYFWPYKRKAFVPLCGSSVIMIVLLLARCPASINLTYGSDLPLRSADLRPVALTWHKCNVRPVLQTGSAHA